MSEQPNPTPEQAKAELERRRENKRRKMRKEPPLTVGKDENGGAPRLLKRELEQIIRESE